MQNDYFITKQTILITGEHDQYGKLCSRVMAGKAAVLIDRSPLQLLDDSIINIGYDLRGATMGARAILGKRVACPVIVNPYLGICLFPSVSPAKTECIWFNPEHIVKAKPGGNSTQVILSNGYSIFVDARCASFKNKIQTAKDLVRLSQERGHHPGPVTFYLEPKKDHHLIKEKTGKYNFSVLEEKKK